MLIQLSVQVDHSKMSPWQASPGNKDEVTKFPWSDHLHREFCSYSVDAYTHTNDLGEFWACSLGRTTHPMMPK